MALQLSNVRTIDSWTTAMTGVCRVARLGYIPPIRLLSVAAGVRKLDSGDCQNCDNTI